MHHKIAIPSRVLCFLIFFLLLLSAQGFSQTYANTQTNSVTGLCLLCGVSNPNNAINNGNLDDYSSINITAGLLGVSVQQTLIFPDTSSGGCDSLIIGIGSGNVLLSANILGGVTVQTFLGNTANNDAQTMNSSILQLLGSNSRGLILLKPNQPFDRVQIKVSSSTLGLLQSFLLYYAVKKSAIPDKPAFTLPTSEVCYGTGVVITNPRAGIYYNVRNTFTSYSSGQVVWDTTYTAHHPLFNTPLSPMSLSQNVQVGIQSVDSLSGCKSVWVTKSFLLSGTPQPPVVSAATANICRGDSVVLSATPQFFFNAVLWYDAAVGGNLIHVGNTFPVKPCQRTIYYVSNRGVCEGVTRVPVTVNVNICNNAACDTTPLPAVPPPVIPPAPATPGIRNPIYATVQSYGVTGQCNSCTVSTPNNPINNNNLNDYSTFVITNGLPGVAVMQSLIFRDTSNIGCDSLIVGIGSGNSTLTAPLFKGVTVQTYLGNTPNNDAQAISGSILRFVDGNTRAELLLRPQYPFDRIELKLNSIYVDSLQSFRIYYAYHKPSVIAPVISPTPTVLCANDSIPLQILNYRPKLYYKIRLLYSGYFGIIDTSYTVRNGANIYISRVNAPPPSYNGYLQVQAVDSLTGCVSDTVQAGFVVKAQGPPIVPVTAFSICPGDFVTMTVTRATSPDIVLWYNAPTGGSLIYNGDSLTVSPAVTTTYYVTTKVNCEYQVRTPVKVTVNNCLTRKAASQKQVLSSAVIYPNPTSGRVVLGGNENWEGSMLVIWNQQGQAITRKQLMSNTFEFPAAIENGIYIIQIIRRSKADYTATIILQR